jgi:hypothetical protein
LIEGSRVRRSDLHDQGWLTGRHRVVVERTAIDPKIQVANVPGWILTAVSLVNG